MRFIISLIQMFWWFWWGLLVYVGQMCNYCLALIGQAKQEGSPPGANQEAKPRQEEGRESARSSRPAVSHTTQTHTFTFYHSSLPSGNLLQAPSPFFCYSSGSVFLSLPPSLCPFILQSYKKAIDEVSDTRVPFILSRFSFASIFRAPLFPLAWWS